MLDHDTLNGMKDNLSQLLAQKDALDKTITHYKNQIIDFCQAQINNELAKKDEPFGTANIGPFSFNTPKKVEWDQVKLKTLYSEIGETAHEYMDISYKVRETAFKNWPSSIQNAFLPARTVQPGSISVKIMEAKDA